ncbi:hypothetical protein JCM10213_006923 [Rhodosporidiobolus nylandii]
MSSARRAITIMVVLLALILAGTVIVLTTVVQYFGVDSRDIIQEGEMRLYERLAAQASNPTARVGHEKQQQVVAAPGRASAGAPEKADVGGVVVKQGEEGPSSVKELLNSLDERGWFDGNATAAPVEEAALPGGRTPPPRIPKLIHATWKTDVLPERWEKVRQGCIDLHPDYEFKLWSDAASRAFIAEHYPWFLSTFDGYTYPIQRADVIRYFVLHHYGGVYMDLDIGCRRNLDPLLYFQVILPATIPVGVSNDLMFAEKGHPFMDLVIHNLITFDHTYGTNYPTVMFSTGPMFLSAQYGLWPKDVAEGEERQVRVLPRRWYGKNALPTQMEDSYFDHFYGSSWHADDAGFITFLGKFGVALMYAGLAIVVLGVVRLVWNKRLSFKATPRPIGPIALPYEALPFARPGTPGSRPASPFGGSRSGTPANGNPRVPGGGKGGIFYMPVWLFPSGEARSPGGRSPNGEQQGNWSQYFSNLSFVEDGQGNRYQPVPNFSRPPSPSNNSILHAPGSTHDGAFDGMPLHSIHAPKPSRPSAPSLPRSSTDSDAAPTHPPSSPNPPAYSTLRSWGTSLFRGSTSPRAPLLPLAGEPGSPLPTSSSTLHAPSDLERRASASSSARPLSPAPPYALSAAGSRPSTPAIGHSGGRPGGAGSASGGNAGGASVAPAPAKAGHGAQLEAPGVGGGSGGEGADELGPEPPLSPALSSASTSSASHSRRASAVTSLGIGGGVEEEVDRLLSEMAPEDYKAE